VTTRCIHVKRLTTLMDELSMSLMGSMARCR